VDHPAAVADQGAGAGARAILPRAYVLDLRRQWASRQRVQGERRVVHNSGPLGVAIAEVDSADGGIGARLSSMEKRGPGIVSDARVNIRGIAMKASACFWRAPARPPTGRA
jgi:hypothetical protein